eukprot:NODE_2918_length_1011_cov_15.481289_g2440_i0.p1 GENE.NODE_2918_length_1011_cov_15.481289_g2440_i0~~NODE_2918_length_1011_cov_15.481289_g2440_i0.p1  ORF type:complete len:199 (+),score=12.04 NODE_2918_length_1011_cov_15.481289_g2440_i0:309-905(+)
MTANGTCRVCSQFKQTRAQTARAPEKEQYDVYKHGRLLPEQHKEAEQAAQKLGHSGNLLPSRPPTTNTGGRVKCSQCGTWKSLAGKCSLCDRPPRPFSASPAHRARRAIVESRLTETFTPPTEQYDPVRDNRLLPQQEQAARQSAKSLGHSAPFNPAKGSAGTREKCSGCGCWRTIGEICKVCRRTPVAGISASDYGF